MRYKINKKLAIDFNEGFRLRENARLPLKSFSETGISYRKNKMIKSRFAYRFIQNFDKAQNLLLRHRFYADFSLRKKLKRWQLSHRARVQHQWGSNKQNNTIDLKYKEDIILENTLGTLYFC